MVKVFALIFVLHGMNIQPEVVFANANNCIQTGETLTEMLKAGHPDQKEFISYECKQIDFDPSESSDDNSGRDDDGRQR